MSGNSGLPRLGVWQWCVAMAACHAVVHVGGPDLLEPSVGMAWQSGWVRLSAVLVLGCSVNREGKACTACLRYAVPKPRTLSHAPALCLMPPLPRSLLHDCNFLHPDAGAYYRRRAVVRQQRVCACACVYHTQHLTFPQTQGSAYLTLPDKFFASPHGPRPLQSELKKEAAFYSWM